MDGVGQSLFVRKIFRHHLHRTPLPRGPIVPILHNHIYRNMPFTEFVQGRKQVVAAHIAFFRLRIAKQIAGHHRAFTCQPAITLYGLIHRGSLHEVIIYFTGGIQHHSMIEVIIELHGTSGIQQQSIPCRGIEDRHHGFEIMLAEIEPFATKVHIVFHVRTEAIESLSFLPLEIQEETPG